MIRPLSVNLILVFSSITVRSETSCSVGWPVTAALLGHAPHATSWWRAAQRRRSLFVFFFPLHAHPLRNGDSWDVAVLLWGSSMAEPTVQMSGFVLASFMFQHVNNDEDVVSNLLMFKKTQFL